MNATKVFIYQGPLKNYVSIFGGGVEGLSNIPYMIPFFINCQVSYYLTYYFHDIGYPIIYLIVTFAYRKVKKYPINNSSSDLDVTSLVYL